MHLKMEYLPYLHRWRGGRSVSDVVFAVYIAGPLGDFVLTPFKARAIGVS